MIRTQLPRVLSRIPRARLSRACQTQADRPSPSPSPSPPPPSKSPAPSETWRKSPSPSTAHSLPLAGGTTSGSARAASWHAIRAAWARVALPKHARWSARDVEPAAPRAGMVFVGVGLCTNWPALHAAMQGRVFAAADGLAPPQRVAAVKDVFDRNGERETLQDWFAVVADDVVAVLKEVVKPSVTAHRFVNEYVSKPGAEGGYELARNDVDLIEYLHASGLRVVPVDTREELRKLKEGTKSIPAQQSTNHLLACAPTAFRFNASAAADNYFMGAAGGAADEGEAVLRRKVLTEFAGLHDKLTDRRDGAGALVHLFTHEDWHNTPDACFPNNTFSTHTNLETGDSCTLVLYPMKDETRRTERRLVSRLLQSGRYTQVYDLTGEERSARPAFLEGTGSLVLDRVNHVAYVALSQRSDARLARMWARVMGYELVVFTATDRNARAIYHTNVMMSVGTGVAVVCTESIADAGERARVVGRLRETGHAVVEISQRQMEQFCGNVLEVENFYGEQVMVMSSGAHAAFTPPQREAMLEHTAKLVHADIGTIERVGGGGVRCTIAELH